MGVAPPTDSAIVRPAIAPYERRVPPVGSLMLAIPIERFTLDNGLRVNLSYDATTPVVAVNLWYGVGSRNEREGKTGFAHLFEHMMFQGSEHVPKNRHFELIERAGGSLNATTSRLSPHTTWSSPCGSSPIEWGGCFRR